MNDQEIRAALGKLDKSNDAHWTEEGAPVLAVLGTGVTRAQLAAVAPMFTRANPELGPAPAAAARAPAPDPFLPPEPVSEEEPQHIKDTKATMSWQQAMLADRVARAARNVAANQFLKTQGFKPQKLAMSPIDARLKNRPSPYVRAAALGAKKAAEASK